MKNNNGLFQSITLLCFSWLMTLSAYSQMEKGHIRYDFSYEAVTSDAQELIAFMPESHYDIYFNPQTTAVHIDMGIYFKMKIIRDLKNEKIMMTKDIAGEKVAISTSFKKYDLYNEESNNENVEKEENSKPSTTYLNETKEIQGYTCKKAIVKEDDQEVTYWYTEEFLIKGLEGTTFHNDISGTILAFEFEDSGVKTICTVTELEDQIEDKSVFDMEIPEGYEEVESLEQYFEEI